MTDAEKKLIYEYSLRLVGTRYSWGGSSALAGFDCSGLVIELLVAAGLWPHGADTTAQGIHDLIAPVSAYGARDFGSLYFFGKSEKNITHIAFGLTPTQMIEAGGGGSDTRTIEVAAKQGAVVRIRPVNFRKDLVAVLMPLEFIQGEK
jgi:cell wall-associated NlpC family hydrolase